MTTKAQSIMSIEEWKQRVSREQMIKHAEHVEADLIAKIKTLGVREQEAMTTDLENQNV